MNCKQGDLAIIVWCSVTENIGKVRTCMESSRELFEQRDGSVIARFAWRVDQPLPGWDGSDVWWVPDEMLRPIRDNDGEDEMLRIAGKPNETPADIIKEVA